MGKWWLPVGVLLAVAGIVAAAAATALLLLPLLLSAAELSEALRSATPSNQKFSVATYAVSATYVVQRTRSTNLSS